MAIVNGRMIHINRAADRVLVTPDRPEALIPIAVPTGRNSVAMMPRVDRAPVRATLYRLTAPIARGCC